MYCPHAGGSSGARLIWTCHSPRQQHHAARRAREWKITAVAIVVDAAEAQHYFPIRLNFAHAGFSVSLLNAYIFESRVHAISVDGKPLPTAVSCYILTVMLVLLLHHRQAYFPENSIYISHRTQTVRAIWVGWREAGWTPVFDFTECMLLAKGTIRFWIGTYFSFHSSRALDGARLARSSSTHTFIVQYAEDFIALIIRLVIYDSVTSTNETTAARRWWIYLMLATAEAACDYCRQTTAMRTKLTNIVTTAYYTYSLVLSHSHTCAESGIWCVISWENTRKCSPHFNGNCIGCGAFWWRLQHYTTTITFIQQFNFVPHTRKWNKFLS